ncbi:hypothetical protein K7432_007496 [Basidiobolus ranarum]|uniref:alpha-1,2-Mannosidase n=1 Tax=Basidiobolus ranarum TaxID=34480 RepID=A0ABR2WTK0_9FUNG
MSNVLPIHKDEDLDTRRTKWCLPPKLNRRCLQFGLISFGTLLLYIVFRSLATSVNITKSNQAAFLASLTAASDCSGIFASNSSEVPRYSTSTGSCSAFENLEHYKLSEKRREQIKTGFLHAWNAYVENALGWDEISPITGQPNNRFNGWGATLFDSLDTLLIMGLQVEFNEAKEYVKGVDFNKSNGVNFFETTIRYLGGLLSAYELSGEVTLLDKAQELGINLLKAFQSKSGYPYNFIDFPTGRGNNAGWTGGSCILAEIGSFQLEFRRLSDLTGNPVFLEKGQKVIDMLEQVKTPYPGLVPIYLNPDTGKAETSSISFGALGDSYYEYLLKQYLMAGSKIDQYRRMYETSIDSMKKYMITEARGQTYLSTLDSRLNVEQYLEHLTCFTPGLLALGSKTLNRPNDLELAKKLVKTCYETYTTTETGLGPEKIAWFKDTDAVDNLSPANARDVLDHGFYPHTPYYILRPGNIDLE